MSSPQTQSDTVKRATASILELIRERGYGPGERLPSERDLAEKFGVSRAVVREAVTTLDVTRTLERRPNAGLFVQPAAEQSSFEAMVLESELGLALAPETIAQSMEVRHILELAAVRLACRRRRPADLERLRHILDETERRMARGLNIVDQDEAFHLAIAVATRNTVFAQIVNGFFRASRERRRAYFTCVGNRRRSHAEHLDIFRAIEAADAAAAARAMTRHLDLVGQRLAAPPPPAAD